MSRSRNVIVPCGLIDPPDNACKVKPRKVAKLAKSIETNGLLQPPGVVAVGNRYRVVYGNHRFHAWLELGHAEIEVRVLPPDTTADQELSISLQENHVREKEDFDDTLARVEKRAKQMKCSFKKAAEIENVNPTYVSRARKIMQSLGSKVVQAAKDRGVGLSVLYEIASVKDVNRQKELFDAYLNGSMNREAIVKATKRKSKASVKKVTINRATDVASIKLVVMAAATYEQIYQQLAELKKQLTTNQKNGIPVKLLPEIMKGGQKDVVLKS